MYYFLCKIVDLLNNEKALLYDSAAVKEKCMEELEKQTNQIEESKSYKYNDGKGLEEGEEPLGRDIGHDNQKKELLAVVNWFKKSKELKAKGISIPRGVILMGPCGCGKSLLIKEIIRCADAPVFVFQGEQDNVVKGIVDVFKKAREVGHAIIVIDELDLLIDRERRVTRALQENLDGVESEDDILVLSATNNLDEIPNALLRNGRLEKIIRIPLPTGKEAVKLFKKYLKEFNVSLKDELDEDELETALHRISCSAVKAIVNDMVLRNGFENITNDMIYESIANVTNRIKDAVEVDNIEISCHEAGHAVMAHAFPEFFVVNRIDINSSGGEFRAKEVEDYFWPYEKVLADIQISMAGIIAEKVLFGRASRGEEEDLQRARRNAYNLVNMNGYSSCWETVPIVMEHSRMETPTKRRHNERIIEKVLRKCEKKTYKYIKKNADKVKKLGQLLFEKKHLKSSEILSCIG